MVIRNKKIIGLISFLVGLAVLGYTAYAVSVIFYGNKTDAVVTGFVFHRNGAKKVQRESATTSVKGRSPFVKFRAENGTETEAHSKVLQLFSFTGYHLGEKVRVAYNPRNPQQIFLLNAKEIPGVLLITAFGILLVLMGKSFIFSKTNNR